MSRLLQTDKQPLSRCASRVIPAHPAIDCAGTLPHSTGDSDAGRCMARAASAISRYMQAAVAENTRRAYSQDVEDFLRWGGTVPCTPEILAAYVAERASRLSPATLARRIVGIGRAHVSGGHSNPARDELVRSVLRGVRRVHGTSQRRVAPLLAKDVEAMVASANDVRGTRDRALILLGFAAALRRSELAALLIEDVEVLRDGLVVRLRRSKTDQLGQGRRIAVARGRTGCCPVMALTDWLGAAAITSGPVFRSVSRGGRVGASALTPQSIALIVKRHAQQAGLDAAQISGHSLRAGLVTSAVKTGVPLYKIQQQTGHRSLQMLARYIRDASLFENNVAGVLL